MPGQLLEPADVFRRGLPDEVTDRPILAALVEPALDHLVDRLGLFRVLEVGLSEALVDVGDLLAVGDVSLEDRDVLGRQLARPFHRRRDVAVLPWLGPLTRDEVEAEFTGPGHQRWDLRTERLEPLFAASLNAAGRAAHAGLQHRHPRHLVGEVPLHVDLRRRLHVEQRLGLVLHRDLRDLQRIDELVGGELEPRRRHLAGEGAVLVALHLHRVDLHHREDPLLLHVEAERRFVAGVGVFVVLEPLVEVVRPACLDDLVVERTDDAGLQHLDRWGPRIHAVAIGTGPLRLHHPRPAEPGPRRHRRHRQQVRHGELPFLHDRVDGEMLEEVARHLVQLRLARRRDHHAEVERVPLELRLHGEGFHLLGRVPREERLLRRLQDVGVLGGEIAARPANPARADDGEPEQTCEEKPTRTKHDEPPDRDGTIPEYDDPERTTVWASGKDPQRRKTNHENTKERKHERKRGRERPRSPTLPRLFLFSHFRVFVILSCREPSVR